MASEQTIEFNYRQALDQANRLTEISNNIRKVANDKLESNIEKVNKDWDGINSKKFIDKGNLIKDKIVDSADDINLIAESIRKMAKAIYDAEMENIRIAKIRSYKQG